MEVVEANPFSPIPSPPSVNRPNLAVQPPLPPTKPPPRTPPPPETDPHPHSHRAHPTKKIHHPAVQREYRALDFHHPRHLHQLPPQRQSLLQQRGARPLRPLRHLTPAKREPPHFRNKSFRKNKTQMMTLKWSDSVDRPRNVRASTVTLLSSSKVPLRQIHHRSNRHSQRSLLCLGDPSAEPLRQRHEIPPQHSQCSQITTDRPPLQLRPQLQHPRAANHLNRVDPALQAHYTRVALPN